MVAPEYRDMGNVAPLWIVLTWASQAFQEGVGMISKLQVTFGSDILEPQSLFLEEAWILRF